MKRIMIAFAALVLCLACACASAATLITNGALGYCVNPVEVIDGFADNPKAEATRLWALSDDRALTSYSFLGWSSMRKNEQDALTFVFNNATLNAMWMRIGDLTSEEAYYAHGRPQMVKVTINCAGGVRSVLYYRMEDRYDLTGRYADWYDGYQLMSFDKSYDNVQSISLFIDWKPGNETATQHYVHISDVMFIGDGSQPDGGWDVPQYPRYGLALNTLYTRSGPCTIYDELGGFELKGQYVPVISAAWDNRNDIWWLQVDVNAGKPDHRRIYTGLKRISIDVNSVPHESVIGSAYIAYDTPVYYGPGPDYERRPFRLAAGTTGYVYNYENGCMQFEYKPASGSLLMRVWVPDSAVVFK